MAVSTIAVTPRYLPMDRTITANGSYTLPRYAFIPHPSLQQLAGPMVMGPALPGQSAMFAAPTGIQQRPYPVPSLPTLYSIRSRQTKSSPQG